MQLKHALAAAICLVALTVVGPANSGIVGPASDYNVFVFGDFKSSSDQTHGNLAAGGNVTFNGGYGVAVDHTGSNGARLVADGNITTNGGGIGKDQKGRIYTNGTKNADPGFTYDGPIQPQTLVNFSTAQTYYQNLSTSWSIIAPNGTSTVEGNQWYTKLTLEGANSALNVFSIDGDMLKDVVDLIIDAPTDATVLINVSGTGQSFKDGQVTLNGGIDSSHIIYNFFESTALALYSGKNLRGSILAPNADVTSNSNGGELDGQLIAGSFDGKTEFHDVPFVGTVPIPAAFWLFGSALGFMAAISRRRKQTV